jgi:hypothetical protein
MSYLFEFDKDYHSSSDSDYNPESESEYESDSESESDSASDSGSELCVTPVKERTQTMPLTPVKKRPILLDVPIDVELVSPVRPLKTCIPRDWKNKPKESTRPIRERKQPIRYQA